MARQSGAETLRDRQGDIFEQLFELTSGRGPGARIDAVGREAHGAALGAWVDQIKRRLYLATVRPQVRREAIKSCRKGGLVSMPELCAANLPRGPGSGLPTACDHLSRLFTATITYRTELQQSRSPL
jgi:threonine dehydrogenase-like Zn-dependent dehydrogenase